MNDHSAGEFIALQFYENPKLSKLTLVRWLANTTCPKAKLQQRSCNAFY